MIRAEAGAAVSKFLSVSFLDLMSHFCDTDIIAPCSEAKCELREEEWNAIPEWFAEEMISFGLPTFDEVGGMPFIRKKIAQLVKIAKAEDEIQLDLVSELILFLIGINCGALAWKDDKGVEHTPEEPIDYPDREALFESLGFDDEDLDDAEYIEEQKALFDSFYTLMRINEYEDGYVFFDMDYESLLEDNIPDGIRMLYTAFGDYDKEWHKRPWTDIGEEVPPAVICELDGVEIDGINFGGLNGMRAEKIRQFQDNLLKDLKHDNPGDLPDDDDLPF